VHPDSFPELAGYGRIILEDFEYAVSRGDRPHPVCATRLELRSGHVERRWLWDGPLPPLDLAANDLYVSYHAPAELCPRLALGWPLPSHVVDLCVEHKRLTNGHNTWLGKDLVGALLTNGIDGAPFVNKQGMQMLAARGGPYTERQRDDLLAYNERDVRALEKLFPAMLPRIDLPRALLRGRYMVEVAKTEHNGLPINEQELKILDDNSAAIRQALIRDRDRHGVWDGETFKKKRWEEWVAKRGLSWPRLKSGRLSLHRDTFGRMAERYPEVKPVRDLLALLSQLRHFKLPTGVDGRTRCDLYTFGTITGRNTPRARDYLFAWPKWCRGLMQVPPGRAFINLDFCQEEYLIAGTLSGDTGMIDDYRQGDVYVGLGKSLGLIPPHGDGKTHEAERGLCKAVVLACNYGMGPPELARKINSTETRARDLLRRHREKYRRFWRWSDATVDYARIHRRLWTKYGWSVRVESGTKETTWRNWRVQATGGDVLRVAVCALGAAGFQIDATVHDSVLLEVDAADAADAAREARKIMVAASVAVLGEPLRVDSWVIGPGGRLLEGGKPTDTWREIWRILEGLPPAELFGGERSARVPLRPR
jgi:hypothetical protein